MGTAFCGVTGLLSAIREVAVGERKYDFESARRQFQINRFLKNYEKDFEEQCKPISGRRSGDQFDKFPDDTAKEELWRRLESLILAPAGLPHGRRDKFHRLRRTSYTMVAKAFGVDAASRHAAHKQDLSKFYLDRTMIDTNPLDALPRPM